MEATASGPVKRHATQGASALDTEQDSPPSSMPRSCGELWGFTRSPSNTNRTAGQKGGTTACLCDGCECESGGALPLTHKPHCGAEEGADKRQDTALQRALLRAHRHKRTATEAGAHTDRGMENRHAIPNVLCLTSDARWREGSMLGWQEAELRLCATVDMETDHPDTPQGAPAHLGQGPRSS